jgi:hypothetical protein
MYCRPLTTTGHYVGIRSNTVLTVPVRFGQQPIIAPSGGKVLGGQILKPVQALQGRPRLVFLVYEDSDAHHECHQYRPETPLCAPTHGDPYDPIIDSPLTPLRPESSLSVEGTELRKKYETFCPVVSSLWKLMLVPTFLAPSSACPSRPGR